MMDPTDEPEAKATPAPVTPPPLSASTTAITLPAPALPREALAAARAAITPIGAPLVEAGVIQGVIATNWLDTAAAENLREQIGAVARPSAHLVMPPRTLDVMTGAARGLANTQIAVTNAALDLSRTFDWVRERNDAATKTYVDVVSAAASAAATRSALAADAMSGLAQGLMSYQSNLVGISALARSPGVIEALRRAAPKLYLDATSSYLGQVSVLNRISTSLWAGVDHRAWMEKVLAGQTQALSGMLHRWSQGADRGYLAARLALRAALDTVDAVKRGDLAALRQFLRQWLGFTRITDDLLSTATMVLLDLPSWLPEGVAALFFDPRPRLRKLTLAEHRDVTRLLIDPRKPALRLNKQTLAALDEPVEVEGELVSLTDTRRDPGAPDPGDAVAAAVVSDPRIIRLWPHFSDRERQILLERGQPRTSWPAAAVACGGTPGEGDRLRRRVNRLAKGIATVDRRQAAS